MNWGNAVRRWRLLSGRKRPLDGDDAWQWLMPQDGEGLPARRGRLEVHVPAVMRHDLVRPSRQCPGGRGATACPAVEVDDAQDLCPGLHSHVACRHTGPGSTCGHRDTELLDLFVAVNDR